MDSALRPRYGAFKFLCPKNILQSLGVIDFSTGEVVSMKTPNEKSDVEIYLENFIRSKNVCKSRADTLRYVTKDMSLEELKDYLRRLYYK